MLTAELAQLVTKLDYGDRAELAGLLIDSLGGEDFEDEDAGEDSVTIALRRSAEMRSGEDPGITLEELMAGVQAGRVKK
ncbi:MAG: addiction module protein [Verrucomicrobia bacterium]|nr:addiction module protein [Verrucomicrobiota bacterium]